MNLDAAIRAAAPKAPPQAIAGLIAAEPRLSQLHVFDNANRAAHMIGQCAHESGAFTRVVESLHYSSGDRIFAVFGKKYFNDIAHASQFAKNQQKLANHVYANRMGNGDTASGDGFRFRGRGYLQLTGRENYRKFGGLIDVDLEAAPERAADPATAWLIAGTYLATRSSSGKTALQWADADNVEMVTRIVNGGKIGLAERRELTGLVQAALGGAEFRPALRRGNDGPAVERLQRLLAQRGFPPGAVDGDFGKKTDAALKAFQAKVGLAVSGRADAATWAALEPASA